MKKKSLFTARNLLVAAIAAWLFSVQFSLMANFHYNRLTQDCVPNRDYSKLSAGQQQLLEESGWLTKEQVAQKRYFCSEGSHAELSSSWEDINRYVTYGALAFAIPVGLCSGLILLRRFNRTRHGKSAW